MVFDSQVNGAHVVRIDAPMDGSEPSGPGPKALLLTALSGCTGMDVVALLRKMRVDFVSFAIAAEAELTEEHPKVYKEILLTYRIAGAEISEEKVRKAIEMSQERYCGVSAMLRAHCPIRYELIIEQT